MNELIGEKGMAEEKSLENKILVSKIAWSNNGWSGFDFDGYQNREKYGFSYVKGHGFAHEWWNFYPFDGEHYCGQVHTMGKIPSSILSDALVLFISINYNDNKPYLVAFYSHTEFGKYQQEIKLIDTIPDNSIREQVLDDIKSSKVEDDKESSIMDFHNYSTKAKQSESIVFIKPIPIDITNDLQLKKLGQASYYLVGEKGSIKPQIIKNLLDRAIIFYQGLLDSEELDEKSVREIIRKTKKAISDYFDSSVMTKLKTILKKKKQIILYGPPGTGKTWHAKNLLSRDEEKINKIDFVTFHPSFGYEEFIEGLRPNTDENGSLTFHIHDGIFKQFAQTACNILFKEAGIDKQWLPEGNIPRLDDDEKIRIREAAPNVPFYLVIDEINRGDISRIFGELITLLEADKRYGEVNEITTTLPYSKTSFAIPPNLYLVGTMNTADKSIALVDTALRRRFGFIEMMPDYELLHRLFAGVPDEVKPVAELAISLLEEINIRIRNRYDRDHQIGHSYLVPLKDAKTNDEAVKILHSAWYYEILPLLQEYFYDSPKKLHEVIGDVFVSVEGDHSFCFTDKLVGEAFIEAVEGLVSSDSSTRIEVV